jgi:AraC family transcriptional regulator
MEGQSQGGLTRSLRCVVSDERFRRIAGQDFEWTQKEIERGLRLESSPVVPLMMRMASEVKNPGFGSKTMLDALSTTLVLELVRYLHCDSPDNASVGRLDRRQLDRIRERVEADDRPSPSVSELAGMCNVGERHFTRMFKNATGRTISECVREAQSVRARRLLVETDLPLKEVAFRLGFSGHSSFTAAFTRAAGESPKTFRRRAGSAR